MALCPICNVRVPFKLVMKTTDVLLFPEEGAEQCPKCHAKLVPTAKSALASVLAFLALAAACFVPVYIAHKVAFVPGFLAGLAAGLVISFGGAFASSKLLRFRTDAGGRYAYDRQTGLGILDKAPRPDSM